MPNKKCGRCKNSTNRGARASFCFKCARIKYLERKRNNSRERYRKNPYHVKQLQAIRRRKEKDEIRSELIKILGAKCSNCGHLDIRVLQFDHIKGGGEKHRREFSHRNQYLKCLLKNTHIVQLLCANCNFLKRMQKEGMKSPYA